MLIKIDVSREAFLRLFSALKDPNHQIHPQSSDFLSAFDGSGWQEASRGKLEVNISQFVNIVEFKSDRDEMFDDRDRIVRLTLEVRPEVTVDYTRDLFPGQPPSRTCKRCKVPFGRFVALWDVLGKFAGIDSTKENQRRLLLKSIPEIYREVDFLHRLQGLDSPSSTFYDDEDREKAKGAITRVFVILRLLEESAKEE